MSEVKKETIICPHCQAKGKMDIWNSVNVDLDPKLINPAKRKAVSIN